MNVAELILRKGLLRGLSPQTIKTYIYTTQKFLRIYRKAPWEVNKNDIENYILTLLERNSSGNTINVYLNALKFFYEEVLHRTLTINVNYYKVPKRLPEFLSKEEVMHLLQSISNQKHLLMIKLLYSSGMRVSELLNLKVQDLTLEKNYGWVRQGKGRKDRVFIIAEKLRSELQEWIKNIPAEMPVFSNHGRKMNTQTVRKILSAAIQKAGITKNVHPHTLRHSFATHLLENGYAVIDLQPLLGHSRIDTTLIYTHLAQPKILSVQSPYDSL